LGVHSLNAIFEYIHILAVSNGARTIEVIVKLNLIATDELSTAGQNRMRRTVRLGKNGTGIESEGEITEKDSCRSERKWILCRLTKSKAPALFSKSFEIAKGNARNGTGSI